MREEKSARSAIPRGILNNEHHIMHDLWVGPIATYIHTEAHLVMRRCSLLGAEFLPVELQAHAPNNTRVRYIYLLSE